MDTEFSVIGCVVIGFLLGWLFGSTYKYDKLMKMNESQQKRGDYWYDKYMNEVRKDWEWLGEWRD